MLLPTANGPAINVMDATDEEFQAFVEWWCMLTIPADDLGWSFDDRCRLINHYRKQGIDLFAIQTETIPNNSETIPDAELITEPDDALEAASPKASRLPTGIPDSSETPILDGWAAIIKAVLTTPAKSSDAGAKGE